MADGERIACVVRGRKNEAAVGDAVAVAAAAPGQGVIEAVLPRTNLLYRSDAFKTKVFAANVTRLLVVVATSPSFSDELVNRALVAARAAGIEPFIVLNKVDLAEAAESSRQRLAGHRALGVRIVECSAKYATQAMLDELAPILSGHVSIVMGQSGMGKSSIVNLLVPEAKAATREISEALHSGKHTTTSTRLYWLDAQRHSALIDSPGFQEFGLAHLTREDIEQGFPEFAPHRTACRFYNCTHRHEPGCGVLAALEAGQVGIKRHALYAALIAEAGLDTAKQRG
jgi:ribosome biogenesis GTPase